MIFSFSILRSWSTVLIIYQAVISNTSPVSGSSEQNRIISTVCSSSHWSLCSDFRASVSACSDPWLREALAASPLSSSSVDLNVRAETEQQDQLVAGWIEDVWVHGASLWTRTNTSHLLHGFFIPRSWFSKQANSANSLLLSGRARSLSGLTPNTLQSRRLWEDLCWVLTSISAH